MNKKNAIEMSSKRKPTCGDLVKSLNLALTNWLVAYSPLIEIAGTKAPCM